MGSTMSTTQHATLAIDGMSCGHCVASVRKALASVAGLTDAQVSVGKATFTTTDGASDRVTADAVKAIEQAGFAAAPAR